MSGAATGPGPRGQLHPPISFEQAGARWAQHECDHCEQPIGTTGTVRTSASWPGRSEQRWLDGAICEQCACEGKRL